MVHVWWRCWDDVETRADLLDPRERGRLQGYRHPADAGRFLAGDSLLRAAVAEMEGRSPDEVRVNRTCGRCGEPHGQPRLPGGTWQASITHAGRWVGVALCRRTVGIDVESPLSLERVRGLEEFVVGPDGPPGLSAAELLRVWVRKEAALKCWGVGLAEPMRDVVVDDRGRAPGGWSAQLPGTGSARGVDVAVPESGYPASVAVVGGVRPEVRWEDGPSS